MPPESRPSVALVSPRVTQRNEGLGRALGVLSLLSVFGPFFGALAAKLLSRIDGLQGLRVYSDALLVVAGWGIFAAIALAIASMIATNTSWPRPRGVRAAVSPHGLWLEAGTNSRSIPRDQLLSGIVIPAPRPRAQLRLRGGRVLDLEVPSEQEGTRLLAALGIGPDKRRVAAALGTANRQLLAGCIGFPMAMILWLALLLNIPGDVVSTPVISGTWLLLTLASAWVLRRAARPTQVVVGADGVRIERPFSTRWIPYADLLAIQAGGARLKLIAEGARKPDEVHAPGGVAEALADRIREAHKRAAAGAGAPRGADALERRGRDLAAWREDLRKLLAAGDYRASSLTPEDAIAALEDPDAPRDRRVGAALALRIAEHPEARERIRFAADTSADEDLRAALEQAAEGEIEEAALARVLR